MEYLQDVLFGEKGAISTNLLSLAKSISLSDSEKLLAQFYDSNKDSLDACYKVVEKAGDKTHIKIVGSQDLPEGNADKRIYIVSPQRANDPVIVAEVGKRARQLQLSAKLKDIVASGFCVNPLLDSEFVAASQLSKKPLGELKREIPPQNKPAVPASAAAAASKAATTPIKGETTSTLKSKASTNTPASSKSATPTKPTTKKSPSPIISGTSTNKEKKPSSGTTQQKPSKFPFQGTTKEEALKSGRKTTSLPVSERIVMATHDSDDEIPEPENDLKKEQQMKNLSKLYDDPEELPAKGSDELANELANEPSQSEAEEDEAMPIEEQEEMDMDPILPSPEKQELEESKANVEKAKPLDESNDAERQKTEKKAPPSAPKNRTRRVLKTIISKDEEGFDVREQVWVDEPIEASEGDPSPESTESPSPKASADKKPTPKEQPKSTESKRSHEESGAGNGNAGGKPVKRSKAPPTIKKANQTSLMSFFGSK